MKKTIILIVLINICFIILTYNQVLATPILEFPNVMTVASETQIDIPINISGIQGTDMTGFLIRLDYDSNQLTNPIVVTNGTLTEGLNLKSGPAIDGYEGKYVISLLMGFPSSDDGVLLKVRFDVSPSFNSANIWFIEDDTQLNRLTVDGYFEAIEPLSYHSGFLMRFDAIYTNETASAGKYESFEDATALAGAMEISVASFDDNGYIYVGHDSGQESFSPGDLDDYRQIVERVWYIKTNGDIPDTTIIQFHINPEMSELSDYGLIFSSTVPTETEDYTSVAQASVVDMANDIIQFELSSAQLQNGYYTLATTKAPETPDEQAHVVPTLNEYGMILFIGLLLIGSLRQMQRRRA